VYRHTEPMAPSREVSSFEWLGLRRDIGELEQRVAAELSSLVVRQAQQALESE
jgi:hypothetical protein